MLHNLNLSRIRRNTWETCMIVNIIKFHPPPNVTYIQGHSCHSGKVEDAAVFGSSFSQPHNSQSLFQVFFMNPGSWIWLQQRWEVPWESVCNVPLFKSFHRQRSVFLIAGCHNTIHEFRDDYPLFDEFVDDVVTTGEEKTLIHLWNDFKCGTVTLDGSAHIFTRRV